MSEIEERANAALDELERDIDDVAEKLRPLLDAPSLDALSAEEPGARKAVPYALGAYALSSMLFAYLRSEGKDVAVVMPELARVKEKMEKVNTQLQGSESAPKPRNAAETKTSATSESAEQPARAGTQQGTGKHTRFGGDGESPPPGGQSSTRAKGSSKKAHTNGEAKPKKSAVKRRKRVEKSA